MITFHLVFLYKILNTFWLKSNVFTVTFLISTRPCTNPPIPYNNNADLRWHVIALVLRLGRKVRTPRNGVADNVSRSYGNIRCRDSATETILSQMSQDRREKGEKPRLARGL